MAREKKLVATVVACAAALSLVTAPSAAADDSGIRISEVYSDAGAGHGDYVELKLATAGQQIPADRAIRLYNATAGASKTVLFPASTILAESQRNVLIAWADNPIADFGVGSAFNLPPTGGAACYLRSDSVQPDPIDCVAWGNFTGSALPGGVPGVGTPAPALDGINSLSRSITRGCPTLFDLPGDDTDNSAADFSLTPPAPQSNGLLPTGTLCPVATATVKAKCKKKKKRSAEIAKKKKCKKKKK